MYSSMRCAASSTGIFSCVTTAYAWIQLLLLYYLLDTGAVAGDEETYTKFAALFDPIIEGRHNGFGPTDTHKTDLNPGKIIGGVFDTKYVLSCRVSVGDCYKYSISSSCIILSTWCETATFKAQPTTALDTVSLMLAGSHWPKYPRLFSATSLHSR